MAIQAIPTDYHGYHFRSRLEVRWAVFFEALGVRYRYEPERFDLGEFCYIPDFYLPGFRMWAEVKPRELNKRERAKARALAQATRERVFLLVGTPDGSPYEVIRPDGKSDWLAIPDTEAEGDRAMQAACDIDFVELERRVHRRGAAVAAIILTALGLTGLLMGHWGVIPWLVLLFAALAWLLARRGQRG